MRIANLQVNARIIYWVATFLFQCTQKDKFNEIKIEIVHGHCAFIVWLLKHFGSGVETPRNQTQLV